MESYRLGDVGTKEMHDRRTVKTERGDVNLVTVKLSAEGQQRAYVIAQMPLDWYEVRSYITPDQHLAGKEYHRLWYSGSTRSPFELSGGGAFDYELRLGNEREWKDARGKIRGDAGRRAAFDVCCMGEFAGKRLPALREALDDLIRHFDRKLYRRRK